MGIAADPANFGPRSNTLLVSNNSVDGTISAFDSVPGNYVGAIRDEDGTTIVLNNLWGIVFGGGNKTDVATNELFITRGQEIGRAELAPSLPGHPTTCRI